jgi:hypothetical protein
MHYGTKIKSEAVHPRPVMGSPILLCDNLRICPNEHQGTQFPKYVM